LELLVYHAKTGAFGPLWNPSNPNGVRYGFRNKKWKLPDGSWFDDQVRILPWIVVSTILNRARNFGTLGFRKRPAIYVRPANEQE
jgi:hypothetical protein